MLSRLRNAAFVLILMMTLTQCTTNAPGISPDSDAEKFGTIVEVAAQAPAFTNLVALLQSEGLVPVLNGEGPFTVFAPVDSAFAALEPATLEALASTPGSLKEVLTYHVVGERLTASDLLALDDVTTLQGESLQITHYGSEIRINGIPVAIADIPADNGVIHGIPNVLIPKELAPAIVFPSPEEDDYVDPPITEDRTDEIETIEDDINEVEQEEVEETEATPDGGLNIVEIASASDDFSTLVQAIEMAGLVETLSGEGSFTVFAPTDDAFSQIPEAQLAALLADTGALTEVLTYHVIPGTIPAEQVISSNILTTLNGNTVEIGIFGATVFINDALILATDIYASNGVIHVIDRVLLPPQAGNILEVAAEAGQFETLLAAVDVAGFTDTLSGSDSGQFTVFAPTDAAFSALPEGVLESLLADPETLANILAYHVIPEELLSDEIVTQKTLETLMGADINITVFGGSWMINDALVTTFDIQAANGVIHVIDTVLLPPSPMSLVQVAEEAGSFETLLAALEATGLTQTLDDLNQNFTVFAPTDAAFSALPEGALESLLSDPETLSELLLYHVLSGKQDAGAVAESSLIATLNGNDVRISVEGDDVFVNEARILVYDIEAANGIIHVIDAVLSLPHTLAATLVSEPETFSTLTTAVSVAGLFSTLNGTESFTLFAPTNAAFAALPANTLEDAFGNQDLLAQILLYHVLSGKVPAADVASAEMFTTAQGGSLNVSIEGDAVKIDDATIITYDIPCSNGVIHVIDAVLIPSLEKE